MRCDGTIQSEQPKQLTALTEMHRRIMCVVSSHAFASYTVQICTSTCIIFFLPICGIFVFLVVVTNQVTLAKVTEFILNWKPLVNHSSSVCMDVVLLFAVFLQLNLLHQLATSAVALASQLVCSWLASQRSCQPVSLDCWRSLGTFWWLLRLTRRSSQACPSYVFTTLL